MARRLPDFLSRNEIDALVETAINAVNSAPSESKRSAACRDFIMVKVCLHAGPRVAELCRLKIVNVDLDNTELRIRRGMGDKDRNVKFCKVLVLALREWTGSRRSGWLFPGTNGRHVSVRTFQIRLQALVRSAGFTKYVHPHTLRHGFARDLHRKKVSLRIIQELLGHASIATTHLYTHVETSDMQEAVYLL
jgi:site-specific recombinase XerD